MASKPPKFPVYDQKKDGNPFDWILRAAAETREKQEAKKPAKIRRDYLTGKHERG